MSPVVRSIPGTRTREAAPRRRGVIQTPATIDTVRKTRAFAETDRISPLEKGVP